MEREGISGTFALQSYFLKRVKEMLTARGRKLAGWNEVAHGGGVATEGTLLMAWEKPEVGIELAREGYDVVMTPGQAYYLDMVQAEAWQEPGASWAGTVPPAHTYAYEAEGDFPEELKDRMKGVQACIWSRAFPVPRLFQSPRLPAPSGHRRGCLDAEGGEGLGSLRRDRTIESFSIGTPCEHSDCAGSEISGGIIEVDRAEKPPCHPSMHRSC